MTDTLNLSAESLALLKAGQPAMIVIQPPPAVIVTPPPPPPPPPSGVATPTGFQMVSQGANGASFKWAAQAGVSFNLRRNGTLVNSAPLTGTTYADTGAPNTTTPGWGPAPLEQATPYVYALTAVEGGIESKPAYPTAWIYNSGLGINGTDPANNTYNYNVTSAYAPPPSGGANQIKITVTEAANCWQPFSAAPFLDSTNNPAQWCAELGTFTGAPSGGFFEISITPTVDNDEWLLCIISRITTGDNYNSAVVTLPGKYGAAMKAGVQASYKIPLADLQVGTGWIDGSISGSTLTVNALGAGINVQGSAFLSGPGVPTANVAAGISQPYLTSTNANPSAGGPGSYPIAPAVPTPVPAGQIQLSRQNWYKFSLGNGTNGGTAGNVIYVDNLGFTA